MTSTASDRAILAWQRTERGPFSSGKAHMLTYEFLDIMIQLQRMVFSEECVLAVSSTCILTGYCRYPT